MTRAVFPFGKPVGPEDVVDRAEFIREVHQRLADGHSIMLAGPRRIGKSSIAKEVLRGLRDVGLYTASVDLFYVTSIEEFGTKLLQTVLENRTGPYRQAARAIQGIRQLLSQAEIRAKVHDLEIGVALGKEHLEPLDLLETAIHTAEVLARKDGKRIVILLDEFQEVERLGGEALLKRLRALFQQQEYTSYLFLGSQTTIMRTIFANRGQAFYRFATLLDMPQIPEEAWKSYILSKLQPYGMHFTEPALDWLLQKTGRHPYCVMAVAYNAYLYGRMQSLLDIDADIVHFAYDQALDQLENIYDVQWQEIHHIKNADAVLAAVIEGIPPYTLPLNNRVVAKALAYLVRISMIVKGQRRGDYRLVEPMFGDWFRRKQTR